MAQPTRKTNNNQKPRSKTVKKKRKPSVSEIIKKNIERSKKSHPKYGTSKLEKKFAKEFLDKLGVKYEEQFYAESIKRYYDFYNVDITDMSNYKLVVDTTGKTPTEVADEIVAGWEKYLG